MKQFLIFIGGLVAGILITILVVEIKQKQTRSKVDAAIDLVNYIQNKVENGNSGNEIQFIEIKGKKGNVTLHTGMSKDSVRILVGKPDKVNLYEITHTSYEEWGYKIINKHGIPTEYQMPDLHIDFKDGRLSGVRQD
ncbi:MAG: hypothetical protein JST50_22340 [Bacteroidetes bacterium]|jgi:hypothetical protein|nr:hypothetical protein [Bacteroidota bacterium]